MEYEGKVMISELQNYFKFEQLCGNEESLNRWVIVPDVNRPGLELAGFYKHTEPPPDRHHRRQRTSVYRHALRGNPARAVLSG